MKRLSLDTITIRETRQTDTQCFKSLKILMKHPVKQTFSVNSRTAKSGDHLTTKTHKIAKNRFQQLDFDGLLCSLFIT